jgi:hypothetical protein
MHFSSKKLVLPLLVVLTFTMACNKGSTPPPSLSAEQLPAALEKAFTKAPAETKELATIVVSALQAQDYGKAYDVIQNLVSKPGLSKEQASVTASSLVTVNTLLQSAQAKGDTKAAEVLQIHRRNK